MRVSSVSVTGLVSGVSDVTGIVSFNVVSPETIKGSTIITVSVFASLELVPDVSVGVLKKKKNSAEMSWLGSFRRIGLASKINVCTL